MGLRLFAATAGFMLILCAAGWLMRPDMAEPPAPPDPADLARMRAATQPAFDRQNPPRLHVPVDYSQGKSAAWWPKGESPLLAQMVSQGKLPPVAERVGSEPCVYRGADGVGKFGGTLIGNGTTPMHLATAWAAATLVRFSPQGEPVVPHVARDWEISRDPTTGKQDYKAFTFHLRKGMRWSDGHPYTAHDIVYWWEHECNDPNVMSAPPLVMRPGGKLGRVEKIDDHTVRFSFDVPHGLFLPMLATPPHGGGIATSPRHYLQKFHPSIEVRRKAPGHEEGLVKRLMNARRLGTERDLYTYVKNPANPELPRISPWVYRTYRPNPPFSYVRNPYYWMVDEQGNQLPYVDRVHGIQVSAELGDSATASGRFTLSRSKGREFTLLLSSRKSGGYEVYRWLRADGSDAMIHVNLNRRPDDDHSRWKAQYLADKRFRQALSLAIDRATIIRACYNGETVAAQVSPAPMSYFANEAHARAFTRFDPQRANQLLDEAGLARRDSEGYRCAPDGTRLTFFLNSAPWMNPATPQFVSDDWRRVGVRTIPRMRDSRLFYSEKAALRHDFTMFTGENEFYPVLDPRVFLPNSGEANFALGYAMWYDRGGLYGDPMANAPGCIPIPRDHPLYESVSLYEQIKRTGDRAEQKRLFDRILEISAQNMWTIGLCTSPMYVMCVKDGFRGVPQVAVSAYNFFTPGNTGMETWYFENPEHGPGVIESIQSEIERATPEPFSSGEAVKAKKTDKPSSPWPNRLVWTMGLGLALFLGIRYPYMGRRLLIMVPTLAVISVLVFTIIHLPPGDFITARIAELQTRGEQADQQEIENIRRMYHLDEPMVKRYARWVGLYWFTSFDGKDAGLLQGNLGRSMAYENKPVEQIVGDRILLTFLVSLGTILFTWIIAVPVGIYSAVRQYSLGDYVFTFVGFIGMCVPSFLLALILMVVSKKWLNLDVDRLFSPKYDLQPFWDWPKVLDLIKHIWVPVLILGISGTAGMIRVMRGNLLDELKRPYVTTARAKGVRPLRLLLKYPVRLALNPFISGIGGIFPALISGGALVAIVLNLTMVGPLMVEALRNSDTMLAGSMLMVLSALGIFGVLVSDLLLLWLDPRIRFKGGTR